VKSKRNDKNNERNKSFRNFKYTKYKTGEQIRQRVEDSAFFVLIKIASKASNLLPGSTVKITVN